MKLPFGGAKTVSPTLYGLAGIQIVLAYEWLCAGWEKLVNPEFVGGMAKTLGYFASKNPFFWYKSFLTDFAIPNSVFFGRVVAWGELLTGIGLLIGALMVALSSTIDARRSGMALGIFSLVVSVLLNANFYFAAGWTGEGTKGCNVVMFWTAALILCVWTSLICRKKLE